MRAEGRRRAASEGSSHGGSAADLASSANSRRHGNPCVQLAAADEAGRARAERECLDIPGFGCLYPFAYTGRAREQHRVRTESSGCAAISFYEDCGVQPPLGLSCRVASRDASKIMTCFIGSAVSCGTCCDKQAAINENEMLSSFTHTHTRFIPSCSVRITSVADASWLLLAWLMAVRTWLPAWPPGPAPPAPAHAMMGHPHHCCLAGVSAVLEAVPPEPYGAAGRARQQP